MNNTQKKFHTKSFVGLCILYLFLIPFLASFGSVEISFGEVITIFTNKMNIHFSFLDYSSINHTFENIVMNLRLPRIILSGIVGAILALVGSSFQAIFKNPLADPFVMGTSSGAALGVTLGLLLGLNTGLHGVSFTSLLAFGGAIGTTILVYNLAKVGEKVSTTSILLAGIVASSIITAFISLVMIFNREEIANIVLMTMGSFSSTSWDQVKIIFPLFVIGSAILLFKSREMNALVMGENDAQNLGVNIEKNKTIILVSAALLVAIAVSSSGIIGFVGIIIPHQIRLLFGANHRSLLPLSFVSGAIFLLICDTFSRALIDGSEIPIGIITALSGGPFFLLLLKKHKNKLI